ncbi:MAG: pseudaminic acid cytidylyltransferase [Bacteroidales bacterium]|jgi:N-acylneuraminate cytidylyltransferase|nr:pseudaminic acid cytidylyltransferase [Bacteroidales bacterium]
MKNIAIIPARGGSKRIPRKNIKPFLGKPIIAYSIETALKTQLFDEVMVSTDDADIAEIARQYGASVPFLRSESTANDFATLADVLIEVVKCYGQTGVYSENVCCILSTMPLVDTQDIVDAFQLLTESNKYQSVYPVVAFSYPILRSLKMDGQGYLSMNWPEYLNTRSQDLKPAYHDSGTFYWVKTKALLEYKTIITPQTGGIVVDEITVQDIDTETDWTLAELKYRLLHNII